MKLKIKHVIPHPLVTHVTEEQKRVLKIVTRNNEHQLDMWMHTSKEKIEKLVHAFYTRKPFIDDLNKNNIPVNDLNDLQYPEFLKYFYQALPIFVRWLQEVLVPLPVKSTALNIIVNISTNHKELLPLSKKLVFDTVLDLYETTDKDYWDEKLNTPKNIDLMNFVNNLDNAIFRWADDAHAQVLLDFIKEEGNWHNSLLLESLANFREQENKKRAIVILMRELQVPKLRKVQLVSIIKTLRKLNASEAKEIIYPFSEFPKNYKPQKITFGIMGYENDVSDAEVRNEAQKAISKFENS